MSVPTKTQARRLLSVNDHWFAILTILPALVVLGIVVALPILKGIYVSFCEYKLTNLDKPFWNQFQNYKDIFQDGMVLVYLKNTVIFVFLCVSVQYVIGMALALLLNTRMIGRGIFRGLILIPWTIPSVVVAITFKWMFHQQFGFLNYILCALGLSDTVNISWTQYPGKALFIIVVAVVWRQLPYMTVMILSGLQAVDHALVEAARIDGANEWRILRHIILPSIRPVTSTALWIAVMNNFQMFTIVYNMTGGGPLNATTTLGIGAYKAAFQDFNFGAGSAIGVIWLAILLIITLVKNRASDKINADYL